MFSGILMEFHVSVFNLGLYVCQIFCFSCKVADTVHGERFLGLNICCFSAIKIFTEILSHCLGHKCLLFSTVKERYLYSRINFQGTPKNRENTKV